MSLTLLFDLLLTMAATVVLAVPVLLVAVAVRLAARRLALYLSNSMGRQPPAMSMGNRSDPR